MQYLTFDEYVNLGGECDSAAFNRQIMRVCGVVANATHSRIDWMAEIPQEVKGLCRDLVDYYNASNESNIESKSQSAGAVSESVSYSVKTKEEHESEIDSIIFDYLGRVTDDNKTPLLYRGYR